MTLGGGDLGPLHLLLIALEVNYMDSSIVMILLKEGEGGPVVSIIMTLILTAIVWMSPLILNILLLFHSDSCYLGERW